MDVDMGTLQGKSISTVDELVSVHELIPMAARHGHLGFSPGGILLSVLVYLVIAAVTVG